MNTATEMRPATEMTREEILREISECEARLVTLRAKLPTSIKSFFRFRCKPEKYVFIYADTREQAERKLYERMNQSYGSGWEIASGVVDHFKDPKIAANNCHGSICRALTEADAREFIKDFHENRKGRADDPDKPKNLPKSQLAQDVESYERFLRRREAG